MERERYCELIECNMVMFFQLVRGRPTSPREALLGCTRPTQTKTSGVRRLSRQSQPPSSSPGPFFPLEVQRILLWTLQGGGRERGGRLRPRRRRRRRCRGLCQGLHWPNCVPRGSTVCLIRVLCLCQVHGDELTCPLVHCSDCLLTFPVDCVSRF